ncbi:hypothetical protein N7520_009696 [Penicillium odoratum]|uniref:uncharacterized protein n=1 Tax=Penicillium odoratum TaxID=1167516 RepID=UPI002547420E|nr:uncharacterized protein N7520_009696 [Penicillium odoratum]KAJ5752779.1 hypothetical protein N7520_009696 [Penicillium odoratum]
MRSSIRYNESVDTRQPTVVIVDITQEVSSPEDASQLTPWPVFEPYSTSIRKEFTLSDVNPQLPSSSLDYFQSLTEVGAPVEDTSAMASLEVKITSTPHEASSDSRDDVANISSHVAETMSFASWPLVTFSQGTSFPVETVHANEEAAETLSTPTSRDTPRLSPFSLADSETKSSGVSTHHEEPMGARNSVGVNNSTTQPLPSPSYTSVSHETGSDRDLGPEFINHCKNSGPWNAWRHHGWHRVFKKDFPTRKNSLDSQTPQPDELPICILVVLFLLLYNKPESPFNTPGDDTEHSLLPGQMKTSISAPHHFRSSNHQMARQDLRWKLLARQQVAHWQRDAEDKGLISPNEKPADMAPIWTRLQGLKKKNGPRLKRACQFLHRGSRQLSRMLLSADPLLQKPGTVPNTKPQIACKMRAISTEQKNSWAQKDSLGLFALRWLAVKLSEKSTETATVDFWRVATLIAQHCAA